MSTFTDNFISDPANHALLQELLMGPSALRIGEELISHLEIEAGKRVLDLGCGCGLTTLLLAKEHGAQVFAADLWISPSENYERFKKFGIDGSTIPVLADATKGLPFAHEYFDILLSVDAYHYFGDTPDMLPALIPYVKKGGYIAIAIPALKQDFGESIPAEMKPWWDNPEIARTIRGIDWWRELWSGTPGIEIVDISEMACHKQAWDEWLASTNPYAVEDVPMMQAEGGKYFNTVQLIAKVI